VSFELHLRPAKASAVKIRITRTRDDMDGQAVRVLGLGNRIRGNKKERKMWSTAKEGSVESPSRSLHHSPSFPSFLFRYERKFYSALQNLYEPS